MRSKSIKKLRRNARKTNRPAATRRLPALRLQKELPTAYDLVSRFSPASRQSLIAALFGTVAVISAYIFVLAPQGYLARKDLQTYIDQKETAVRQTETRNVTLAERIAALESDDDAIEEIARDALSMARADETIYRIEEGGPPAYVLNPSF